jgi:hypothetical protein
MRMGGGFAFTTWRRADARKSSIGTAGFDRKREHSERAANTLAAGFDRKREHSERAANTLTAGFDRKREHSERSANTPSRYAEREQASACSLCLSGRRDLNPRPPEPHSGALPSCATSRTTSLHQSTQRSRARPPDPTTERSDVEDAACAVHRARQQPHSGALPSCATSRTTSLHQSTQRSRARPPDPTTERSDVEDAACAVHRARQQPHSGAHPERDRRSRRDELAAGSERHRW